jgi:hypothetical protein
MQKFLRRKLKRLGREHDEALNLFERYSTASAGDAVYDDVMLEYQDEDATRKEMHNLVRARHHMPSLLGGTQSPACSHPSSVVTSTHSPVSRLAISTGTLVGNTCG